MSTYSTESGIRLFTEVTMSMPVITSNISQSFSVGTFTNVTGVTLPALPSGMEQLQANKTYKLALTLLLWTLPMIIIFGTIGNILSFVIMLQREMRQTSTFFYLAALAVADTLVLFVSAFKTWIRLFSGHEMLHISDASCKILMFLTYFSLHFSAWLIVAVTVERFIVVWFPLKATSICSTTRAKLTTLGIGLFLMLLNIHLLWTAELIESTSGKKTCAMLQNYQFLYEEVVPWLHLTLYSVLPFISLLVFNILIIVSLVKHRKIVTSHQMTKDDRRTRYNHQRLAITLLSVSFAWIITTTPSALYTVLPLHPSTIQEHANLFLVKIFCYILMYTNHSINFLLYCITGLNFRQVFIKVMTRVCQRKKKPKARMTFKTSRSGSGGQETTFNLLDNKSHERGSKKSRSSQILLQYQDCYAAASPMRTPQNRPTALHEQAVDSTGL